MSVYATHHITKYYYYTTFIQTKTLDLLYPLKKSGIYPIIESSHVFTYKTHMQENESIKNKEITKTIMYVLHIPILLSVI